jgi:hypothetical protein
MLDFSNPFVKYGLPIAIILVVISLYQAVKGKKEKFYNDIPSDSANKQKTSSNKEEKKTDTFEDEDKDKWAKFEDNFKDFSDNFDSVNFKCSKNSKVYVNGKEVDSDSVNELIKDVFEKIPNFKNKK